MIWRANRGYEFEVGGRLTPAVKTTLIACFAVWFVQLVLWSSPALYFKLMSPFELRPGDFYRGFVWQLFTYMFLHSATMPLHILFNMLMLFMLGPETERGMGTKHFVIMYVLSGVLGGLGWVLVTDSSASCVGASGALFGLVAAFATLYPQRPITLLLFFVIPITMKAWMLAAGLGAIQLVMLVNQQGGQIAYGVHLAGAVAGLAYTLAVFRRDLLPRRLRFPRPFARSRLTVIPGGLYPDTLDEGELDQILDKIARQGMASLTRRERSVLEQASRRR